MSRNIFSPGTEPFARAQYSEKRRTQCRRISGTLRMFPANISRHLSTLAKHGMVIREARGTTVYYRIADESIYALCDLVWATR